MDWAYVRIRRAHVKLSCVTMLLNMELNTLTPKPHFTSCHSVPSLYLRSCYREMRKTMNVKEADGETKKVNTS